MGFRDATQRNQNFKKSTSISTSNINKVNVPPVTKRPSGISQHNTDWRLRDIITTPGIKEAYADPYDPNAGFADGKFQPPDGGTYVAEGNTEFYPKEGEPNYNPYGQYEKTKDMKPKYIKTYFDHVDEVGWDGVIKGAISELVGNPHLFTKYDDPNHPDYKERGVAAEEQQIQDETSLSTPEQKDFTPQKNTPPTEKFNTFTPTYDYQYDDALQKEIQKQKEQHPDAFKNAGAWANTTKPTMQITGGSQSFNQETHGKVQTQLNKQQLNREMKGITDIWRTNFLMRFGKEDAPTKAEARSWVDEQKQIIASKGNMGGYNYGGHQQMYMDDLESRFTNLYGMSNKDNKNRKLTKAEELYQIKQERDLTEKERQQLGILTGTIEKPKKKKIEYAPDGTWANPFPNNTNFGGYEQFL